MSDVKICKDCKHCKPTTWRRRYEYATCRALESEPAKTDLVSGEVTPARDAFCSVARNFDSLCGPSAKYFEPMVRSLVAALSKIRRKRLEWQVYTHDTFTQHTANVTHHKFYYISDIRRRGTYRVEMREEDREEVCNCVELGVTADVDHGKALCQAHADADWEALAEVADCSTPTQANN